MSICGPKYVSMQPNLEKVLGSTLAILSGFIQKRVMSFASINGIFDNRSLDLFLLGLGEVWNPRPLFHDKSL